MTSAKVKAARPIEAQLSRDPVRVRCSFVKAPRREVGRIFARLSLPLLGPQSAFSTLNLFSTRFFADWVARTFAEVV
jgi:hypothetical protein